MTQAQAPVGYFGILIPAYNFYQGYNLYAEHESLGVKFLETTRKVIPDVPSEVKHPSDGVLPEDQAIFGATTSVLVDGATRQANFQILASSWAIVKLANAKFFMVEAIVEKGGIGTTYWRMPASVTSPDAAKDYINGLPEVAEIKKRLVGEAVQKHTTKPN